MKISLTDREAVVMQVLWDHGQSVVSDVQSRLSDRLAYTTVLAVLRTLEAKRYVKASASWGGQADTARGESAAEWG